MCVFGGCVAQNSLITIMTPIGVLVKDAYHTESFIVSSNNIMFYVMLFVLIVPCVYLLDSGRTQGHGMMIWFKIACTCTIVGQWGRYLVLAYFPDQFWLTIVPSGVIGIGFPFILNGISKFACIWFGDKQRAIAIGVLHFSIVLGAILGMGLGPLFVKQKYKDDY